MSGSGLVVLAGPGSGASLASESVSPGEVLAVTGSLALDDGDFGLRGDVRRYIVRNLRKTLGMRAGRRLAMRVLNLVHGKRNESNNMSSPGKG